MKPNIKKAIELGKTFRSFEKENGITEAGIVLYKAFCAAMDKLEGEDRELVNKLIRSK